MTQHSDTFNKILQYQAQLETFVGEVSTPNSCIYNQPQTDLLPTDPDKLSDLLYDIDNAREYTEEQKNLIIKFLIEAGANLPNYFYGSRCGVIPNNVQILLNRSVNPLSPTYLLQFIIERCGIYNFNSKLISFTPEVEVCMEWLLAEGADLPEHVPEFLLGVIFKNADLILNRIKNPISATDLLRLVAFNLADLLNLGDFNGGLTQVSIKEKAYDLINLIIARGADIHAMLEYYEKSLSVFEHLFTYDCLDLIKELPRTKIRSIVWWEGISKNLSVMFIVKMLRRFQDSLVPEEIFDLARAVGASISQVQSILDIYSLAKDYLKAIEDLDCGLLNALEISLLSGATPPLSAAEYATAPLLNRYKFSALHLALLGENFLLAKELIVSGHSLTTPSASGLSALEILASCTEKRELPYNLMALALNKAEKIDISLGAGGTLTDSLMSIQGLTDVVLRLTTDPLFRFLKQDADLFELDTTDINIAISHAEGFWSTGIWSESRLIHEAFPKVNFYLVTLEAIERGGDKFIQQFDGWINPGGGDDYPSGREFTNADWTTSMSLIITYGIVQKKTAEFSIPSLGICAGAQNLALFSGGALYSLKGYTMGSHSIVFLEGTMAHFMAMSRSQQKVALASCDFPTIIVVGDTAHGFAAASYKLGALELGAISAEDGVAMAYSHKLAFAAQFHAEHAWHLVHDSSINHHREWINNFLHLAQLHHDARNDLAPHPGKILDAIQVRLDQCVDAPTSLSLPQPLLGDEALSDAFFN